MDSALSAWVKRATRATGIRYMKASNAYYAWRDRLVGALERTTDGLGIEFSDVESRRVDYVFWGVTPARMRYWLPARWMNQP